MKQSQSSWVLLILFFPLVLSAQNISNDIARKKLEAMQQKGKGMFKVVDEKAVKQENGDVITTSFCFCDSMPGATRPGYNYFHRRYGLTIKDGKKLDPLYDYVAYWEKGNYLIRYREFGPGTYNEESWFALVDRNFNVLRVYEEDGIIDKGFAVKKNGKYGIVSDELLESIPFMYDTISKQSVFEEVNILVKERSFPALAASMNKKWGIITTQNDEVIPFKYEYLDNLYRGNAIAKSHGKWGIINLADSIMLPFVCDSMYRYGDYYVVRKGKKLGILDGEFNYKKVECQYEEIAFNPGMAQNMGRIGTQWYFLKIGKIAETDKHFDGFYFDKDSGPFIGLQMGDKWAIYDSSHGKFKTEFVYSKIIDVIYERAQEYYEDGSLRSDYPVYRFKAIKDGKEEGFILNN
jgi:hypothetical protein